MDLTPIALAVGATILIWWRIARRRGNFDNNPKQQEWRAFAEQLAVRQFGDVVTITNTADTAFRNVVLTVRTKQRFGILEYHHEERLGDFEPGDNQPVTLFRANNPDVERKGAGDVSATEWWVRYTDQNGERWMQRSDRPTYLVIPFAERRGQARLRFHYPGGRRLRVRRWAYGVSRQWIDRLRGGGSPSPPVT